MTELQNLPSGWDCKVDSRTGKFYYVNHYTKTTTWEDPRARHRPLQGTPKHFSSVPTEHIPLQYGSPVLGRNYVYPSHSPPIHAFQMTSAAQNMRTTPHRSPLSLRNAKVQDSSFTATIISSEPEDSVAKIGAMFPTASETHIKLLLKKYLNREALVISALQVEKHPITTPGPFSTPPPQRNQNGVAAGLLSIVSRTGSPVMKGNMTTGSPRFTDRFQSSPKPHSSPKLKLRYMKSLFPNADETIILEVLQNHDANIQKTSESLKAMGYSKKDAVKPATPKADPNLEKKKEENKNQKQEETKADQNLIRIKTKEEKQKIKRELQEKYKDVAEHLINIALESVNFDENRANQILQIMIQEDTEAENNRKNLEESQKTENDNAPSTSQNQSQNLQIPISQSRQSIKSILKSQNEKKDETPGFSRILDEIDGKLKSTNLCNTIGHNNALSNGPNEKLLLENYVQWQGPKTSYRKGTQSLAKGPNKSLKSNKIYQACGPNAELRKGPKSGLAKGSIFAQMKAIVVGENRVK